MDEDKQVKLSVYVNEDTRAKFKAACAIQKVSMNQVVNQLLEDWLKENDATQQRSTPSSDTRTTDKSKEKKRK